MSEDAGAGFGGKDVQWHVTETCPAPEKCHNMAEQYQPRIQTTLAGYLKSCIVQFAPELNDTHSFLLSFQPNFFFKLKDFFQNCFPVCNLFFRLA
ncbi:hypothetical protein IAJ19_001063, partial [Salmonella enterica]|nr:hypothetical protein [Salmonella enterica]EGD6445829.1 hypothetical protein [Salmonella enterica]EGD6468033.1 hypothetical protein [Salmonella enterica]